MLDPRFLGLLVVPRMLCRLILLSAALLAASGCEARSNGSPELSPVRPSSTGFTPAAEPALPQTTGTAIIQASAGSCIPERAVDLIIAFEVGSPETYQAKYRAPIYPGGASGPTVGVGYDLGHAMSTVVMRDWEKSPHAARMATASGVFGPELSPEWVKRNADIAIEWGLARQVFDQTNLLAHCRIAERSFGDGLDRLEPNCKGAVVSVVFNRGGSMKGESRREMRVIRDTCLTTGDESCVADQIRSMARINKGTSIERGITRRRNKEAELCEL